MLSWTFDILQISKNTLLELCDMKFRILLSAPGVLESVLFVVVATLLNTDPRPFFVGKTTTKRLWYVDPKVFWKTSNPRSTNCQLVANLQLDRPGFSFFFEFLIDSKIKKKDKLFANSWQHFFFRKKHLRHIRLWLAWVFC